MKKCEEICGKYENKDSDLGRVGGGWFAISRLRGILEERHGTCQFRAPPAYSLWDLEKFRILPQI